MDKSDAFLDKRLIAVVMVTLGLLWTVMLVSLGFEWSKYDGAINVALKQKVPDHAAALGYARAMDAGITKTSSMMLAFVVVFLGALYVLRSATAAYSLKVAGQGVTGNLETASPGLVMVTLGLALVAVTVLVKSDVNYAAPATVVNPVPAPAASEGTADGAPDVDVASPTLKMEPTK